MKRVCEARKLLIGFPYRQPALHVNKVKQQTKHNTAQNRAILLKSDKFEYLHHRLYENAKIY